MLRDTPAQNRFEVGQIGHVDDLIDTVHEGRHGVIRGETMAEQNNEKVAPTRARSARHFREDRVGLKRRAFEVFVDNDHVVDVGLELEDDVFGEKTEVHFVVYVDQLRHNDLLILLMIHANQRGVIPEIEKCVRFVFHGSLVKSVGLDIQAKPGIEIGIDAAGFLHKIDRAGHLAFA